VTHEAAKKIYICNNGTKKANLTKPQKIKGSAIQAGPFIFQHVLGTSAAGFSGEKHG
jgi:hypothetical protein